MNKIKAKVINLKAKLEAYNNKLDRLMGNRKDKNSYEKNLFVLVIFCICISLPAIVLLLFVGGIYNV